MMDVVLIVKSTGVIMAMSRKPEDVTHLPESLMTLAVTEKVCTQHGS